MRDRNHLIKLNKNKITLSAMFHRRIPVTDSKISVNGTKCFFLPYKQGSDILEVPLELDFHFSRQT